MQVFSKKELHKPLSSYLHGRRIFRLLGRHHGHPRDDLRHHDPDHDGRGRVLLEFCKNKRFNVNQDQLCKLAHLLGGWKKIPRLSHL